MAVLLWCRRSGVEWHHIPPERHRQKLLLESFNRRFRDEFLKGMLFSSLADAWGHFTVWQQDANLRQPYSGLENIPPAAFVAGKGVAICSA
ncbi:integrase core domain-containing protein [Vannielia sp.]|uniref:integrase core domain-containing protein n=1 Tax=Vannielia sp. TaxID=2813045 RepID=UPI003BA9B59C